MVSHWDRWGFGRFVFHVIRDIRHGNLLKPVFGSISQKVGYISTSKTVPKGLVIFIAIDPVELQPLREFGSEADFAPPLRGGLP
jgi:hypothetical protein